MTDALKAALDRFDVPPMSAALADRIVAATAPWITTTTVAPRRDRRGTWRRGRQVVLGSLAVALLSAGAVASGLLGRVGIKVPVLTAMLAPAPKPVAKSVSRSKPPITRTAAVAPPPLAVAPPQVASPPILLPAERMALRQERRARLQAFAADHPVAAAAIRVRVRDELQRRAQARRLSMLASIGDTSVSGAAALAPEDRASLMRAARRDRLIAERMIDRRIQARAARIAERRAAGQTAAVGAPLAASPPSLATDDITRDAQIGAGRIQPLSPEERTARRARFAQMPPEQRAQVRERMQQRRAARLAQKQGSEAQPDPGEGNLATPR